MRSTAAIIFSRNSPTSSSDPSRASLRFFHFQQRTSCDADGKLQVVQLAQHPFTIRLATSRIRVGRLGSPSLGFAYRSQNLPTLLREVAKLLRKLTWAVMWILAGLGPFRHIPVY